jgi:hypothetical protein
VIEERKNVKKEAEEVKEILGVVSKEIPALIRGIVGSIFSEEAGRDMGRAAAAFYKELKEGGMPEVTAVKMTENYIGTFTSLGDVLKKAVSGGGKIRLAEKEIEKEAEKSDEAMEEG